MIERLTFPDQANFTTVEGRQPYFHKYTTPITKLRYANSVTNVLSNGCSISWYYNTTNVDRAGGVASDWTETAFSGIYPMIKLWYGGGYPEVIQMTNKYTGKVVKEFGVKFSGYFRSVYTGHHNFYVSGEGSGGVFTITDKDSVEQTIKWGNYNNSNILTLNNKNYIKLSDVSLTDDNWYQFSLKSIHKFSESNNGIMLMWDCDSYDESPEKMLVSSDLLSTNNPGVGIMPVIDTAVPFYENIELEISDSTISKLTFRVPFVCSTDAYTYKGYFYNRTDDCYEDISTHRKLQKYRMITYYEGYRNSLDIDQYVKKFTGQIRDFSVAYNKEGNEELEITCYDYGMFTKDVINLVSPTPLDYWQVGYLDNIPGRYNGVTKPRTFDGWKIKDVFKILLTESFIDAHSFYNRKVISNYDDGLENAYRNVEPIVSNVDDYLPIKMHYGNPGIVFGDNTLPDDEYAYKISTGEYYKDAIDKIMTPFYYKWGFTEDGSPFLKRINVPIIYKDDRNVGWDYSAGWTNSIDIDCFKGTYKLAAAAALRTCSCSYSCKDVDVLFRVGPRYGSSDGTTDNVNIRIYNDKGNVHNVDYNLYYSTTWGYYTGADPSTNLNPSVISIRGLRWDDYVIVIKTINYNYPIAFDGILIYDENYDTPKTYFYTGDSDTAGSVVDLKFKVDVEDQRSDCVVLGSLTGTKMGKGEKGQTEILNQNNPIYTYVQSISRDINSVYKSTASNFIGHPRMTLIYDPSIVSQDHADFVSFNLINEYNTPHKTNTFTIAGHPMMQVGDCVAIIDNYKKAVSTADYCWITRITNKFSDTYLSNIETSPVKPVSSYWEKPSPSLSDYNNKPIQNFKLYNQGYCKVKLSSALLATNTSQCRINIDTQYLPKMGYFYIAGNNELDYEIIKYTEVSTPGIPPYFVRRLTRGLGNWIKRPEYASSQVINFSYDPYTQETMGITPIISFDCILSGEIQVKICSFGSDKSSIIQPLGSVHVDTLTGIGSDEYPEIGYDNIIWGKNKRYTWGAFDQIGIYNNIVTENEIVGGNYVVENFGVVPSNTVGKQRKDQGGNGNNVNYLSYSQYYDNSDLYGQFFVEISIKSPYGNFTYNSFETSNAYNKYIYTRRGPIGKFDFWFSTAGLYWYKIDDANINKEVRGGGIEYSCSTAGSSTYPSIKKMFPDGSLWIYAYPVYIKNSSNNMLGLKCNIQEVTDNLSKDKDLSRMCSPNIQYNVYHVGFIIDNAEDCKITDGLSFTDGVDYFDPTIKCVTGDIEMSSNNNFIFLSSAYSFYFNPKLVINKESPIYSVDNKLLAHIQNVGFTNAARIVFSNIVFFSGVILDRSGRKMKQKDFSYIDSPNKFVQSELDTNRGLYEYNTSRYSLFLKDEMKHRKSYVHWLDESSGVSTSNIINFCGGYNSRPGIWKEKLATANPNSEGFYILFPGSDIFWNRFLLRSYNINTLAPSWFAPRMILDLRKGTDFS